MPSEAPHSASRDPRATHVAQTLVRRLLEPYFGSMMIDTLTAAAALLGTVGDRESLAGSFDGPELHFNTNSGAVCRGHLHPAGDGVGSGIIACSDGRHGSFTYHVVGEIGTGHGQLEDQPLVLIFG